MGQRNSSLATDLVNSACQPLTSGSQLRRSLRRSLRRRLRGKDISATFNMISAGYKAAQVDVNTATEEQLAQLPGLSPPLAANIVAHRAALGGFTHTEDLALVNGIGAARLHRIRASLCVGRPAVRVPVTLYFAPDSPESRSGAASPHKININTATIFDLMQVKFICQEMADRIVSYRDKKGGFRSLRQLSKVRGISRRTVDVLRHYFTLDEASEQESSSSERTSVTAPADVGGAASAVINLGHRRSHSVPLGVSASPFLEASCDICELLALHSPRPVLEEVFMSQRGGRPVFRLATWNLERLCADKVANPGVLEVVCRTILEAGLGLVAVQELFHPDALGKICSELNTPTLHKVKNWQGWRGAWRWAVSEPAGDGDRCGFLYDVSKGVQLLEQTLVRAEGAQGGVMTPYVGRFKVDKFHFSVIAVRLRWPTCPPSVNDDPTLHCATAPLEAIEEALGKMLRDEQDILVVGDFSRPPDDLAFEVLRRHRFHPVVPEGVTTGAMGAVAEAGYYSNIWMMEHTEVSFTGHYSVVRFGLSHLAIPHGWRWGGVASAHCPVWCEMFSAPVSGGDVSGAVAALQLEYRRHEELHRREMAALSAPPGAALQVS